VYIVGLPDDIAGLFGESRQTPSPETGLVLAPEEPHIKGIALARFSRAKLEEAVTTAKTDVPPPVEPPLPAPVQSVPEPAPAPPPEVPEPPELPGPPEVPPAPMQAVEVPPPPMQAVEVLSSPLPPLPWVLGALLLAAAGGFLLVPRRVAGKPRASFVLEVQEETRDARRVPLVLGEDEQKTLGPRGDIALLHSPELPAVVGTLRWSKEQLWLTPQDTLTVNGRLITTKTPVGPGDRLKVRENVHVIIDEGEETT
jgi:hypothetical protein